MGEVGERGYLKIGNEADRVAVASILYKNGYTVTAPLRNFTPRDSLYVLELCMSGDWVGAESIIRKSRMKVSRL